MNKTVKKITIIGLILVTVFFLYRTFAPRESVEAPQSKNGLTVSTSDVNDPNTPVKKENIQELLALLLSINNIKLSNTLFSRAEFISLKDFSISEVEQKLDESMGRSNPFLPIGDESGGEYVSPNGSTSTGVGYLKTNPVTSATISTALLVGENTFTDTSEQYFEWGKTPNPPFESKTPIVPKGVNSTFTYTITKLIPNTAYYYRAVLKKNDGSIVNGLVQSFKTPKL